jgi:hypothetical protein
MSRSPAAVPNRSRSVAVGMGATQRELTAAMATIAETRSGCRVRTQHLAHAAETLR